MKLLMLNTFKKHHKMTILKPTETLSGFNNFKGEKYMDTRNYDDAFICGIKACDCREDNTCGCTYPNNISDDFRAKLNKKEPQTDGLTNYKIKNKHICTCGPKGCDCSDKTQEFQNK